MRLFGTSKIIDNDLVIAGVPAKKLAKEYGTPLYVFDEAGIDEKIETFKRHFKSQKFNTRIIYAGKAFLSAYLIQQLTSHQLYLDVVSGGELYLAKQANFNLENVYFHGNAKTHAELEMAVDYQVGTIVLDNTSEAEVLNTILANKKTTQRVLLRVNPTIETKTHKYIQTSNDDSKFGMNFEEAKDFLKDLDRYPQLDFKGFHCHIGSQIFDMTSYFTEALRMVAFYQEIEKNFNLALDELNLGGGFGVYYTKEDTPFALDQFLTEYIKKLETLIEEYGINVQAISIEPGRSLINDFGTMLYSISHVKPSANFDFAFIDGGMNDNLRPSLYQAKYTALLANKAQCELTHTYRIAGKLCESGDVLIDRVQLPEVERGDILAVPSAGAYTQSMASNYNKIPHPGVVFVKDGQVNVAVKRETYEDLFRNEVL
ncbi:diaminopimelate decarboxylase [Dolosicoccus paucivorans]|uniref:diaminopimelate decarboxylase n=1 Tax=Dolosicoccus paucivorans TaxID=84521 RepID=UPI0008876020|nr:diaminopimelate decarboxylase [Dolosicoccus paucivorans]SDI89987.1 diaminopimelate decarboxylase [Dolosicoccus paucivorans]